MSPDPRPSAGPKPTIRDPERRERLAALLAALTETGAGRELGLRQVQTLDDFRAFVPMHDLAAHTRQVTARLGFSAETLDPEVLSAASRQRAGTVATWRQHLAGGRRHLAGGRPERIALLQAQADDPLIDQLRVDDLQALAGGDRPLLRITSIASDPEATLARLHEFAPDALVMPSLATCAWLEAKLRAPLERRIPSLRWLFAEYNLSTRVRSRLPVVNTGWLHAAGRIGLPARRSPWWGFELATHSTLIELLAHGDPELDPHSGPSERTVLPEAAILGERYELVLSSALGFLRLRSGLHVRVVGFVPPPAHSLARPLPIPRVVRLPPPPPSVALEGVTMSGACLTAAVRQAFLPEDPALISALIAADPGAIDPDARASRTGLDPFADTELGASRAGLRRKGPRPRALVVRLEVQGQPGPMVGVDIAARLDRDLQRRSAAYAWLRTRDELWEPRVVFATAGTARMDRERAVRGLWGRVPHAVVRVSA